MKFIGRAPRAPGRLARRSPTKAGLYATSPATMAEFIPRFRGRLSASIAHADLPLWQTPFSTQCASGRCDSLPKG